MNKARVEALSDGVFSIVMTLLIFDIKVPVLPAPVTDIALWHELGLLWPHMLVYAGTFIVLSTMWINHHFLFQFFAKEVDRKLNLLNLVYLMFVAAVPFSASFLAEYHLHQPAIVFYGLNLLVIAVLSILVVRYLHRTQGLEHLSDRMLNQSRFRSTLNVVSYLLGILLSFWTLLGSIFFFIFPVIFNVIPGTLNFTERLLGLNLGPDPDKT